MDPETIAILTMPLSNLNSLNRKPRNTHTLVLIFIKKSLMFSFLIFACLVDVLTRALQSHLQLSSSLLVNLLHVIYAPLIALIGKYLERYYYRRLRLIGYHHHFTKATKFNRLTYSCLQTTSFLLLSVVVLFQLMELNPAPNNTLYQALSADLEFNKTLICQIIVILECIICLGLLIKQFLVELKFRRSPDLPDVFFIENPQLPRDGQLNELGIRETAQVEDLLYRQYELIESITRQNRHLREVLFKISRQASIVPSNAAGMRFQSHS